MSKPSNHGRAWETSDWDHLRNLMDQDVNLAYIAKKMGRTMGATAIAMHRLRHGKTTTKRSELYPNGAKFTSYTKAQVDKLTHREARKVRRRARVLFNLVLFGLRFTIRKADGDVLEG